MPLPCDRLRLTVIGTEQEAGEVPLVHRRKDLKYVLACSPLTEHHIHPLSYLVVSLLWSFAFMVGLYACRHIAVKCSSRNRWSMSIYYLIEPVSLSKFCNNTFVCTIDTRIVHHLTKSEYPWIVDERSYIFRTQYSTRVFERCCGNTGREHEENGQGDVL